MKTKSYHVTNTNSSGPGSLRAACQAAHIKGGVIEFDVGGVFGNSKMNHQYFLTKYAFVIFIALAWTFFAGVIVGAILFVPPTL